MPKRHSRSNKRHSRRHKKGGNSASPSTYSDASSYMLRTVGTGEQQYNNVFSQSSSANGMGNAIVGLQGQKAGRRRKSRKGGFWGSMLSQAVVPLSILGMQQSFRKRGSKMGTRSRRHRRR